MKSVGVGTTILVSSLLMINLLTSVHGHSEEIQIRKDKCSFPFVYEGKSYDFCTKENSNFLWCSIKPVYDGEFQYCEDISVKTEEVKDDYSKVYELLEKNRKTLLELKKQSADGECDCVKTISYLEKAIFEITLIVKHHEKRFREFERRVEILKILREVFEEISIHWVVIKRLLVNEGVELIRLVEEITTQDRIKKETGDRAIETEHFFRDCSRKPDTCYLFFKTEKTFEDARKTCQDYDGDLVETRNEAENQWLTSRTLIYGKKANWFIGIRRTDNGFRYLSGKRTCFTKWLPGRPGNETIHVLILAGADIIQKAKNKKRAFWKSIQTNIFDHKKMIRDKYKLKLAVLDKQIKLAHAKANGGNNVLNHAHQLFGGALKLARDLKETALRIGDIHERDFLRKLIQEKENLEREFERELIFETRGVIKETSCMRSLRVQLNKYQIVSHIDMMSTVEDFIFQLAEIQRYEALMLKEHLTEHVLKKLRDLTIRARERISLMLRLNLPMELWNILEEYGLVKVTRNESSCVIIGPNGNPFWKDISCSRHSRFICKISAL